MFTGIITANGHLQSIEAQSDPIYTIATEMPLQSVSMGASIACNGVCLTVIRKTEKSFGVQLSGETFSKTTALQWQVGKHLNLERPMQAGDEFGGHFVSGHVDGIASIIKKQSEGGSWRFLFQAPGALQRFIAPKGSITIDGVSLTVNEVSDCQFGVNIIPHTWQHTNFSTLQVGEIVNIEIDLLARYLDRLLEQRGLTCKI